MSCDINGRFVFKLDAITSEEEFTTVVTITSQSTWLQVGTSQQRPNSDIYHGWSDIPYVHQQILWMFSEHHRHVSPPRSGRTAELLVCQTVAAPLSEAQTQKVTPATTITVFNESHLSDSESPTFLCCIVLFKHLLLLSTVTDYLSFIRHFLLNPPCLTFFTATMEVN